MQFGKKGNAITAFRGSAAIRIALLVAVLSVVLPSAGAQFSQYCNTLMAPNAINTNILPTVFLVVLVMLSIVALAYLFGSAFKFDRLVRFARAEIGEVIVTVLVVSVFIGGIFTVGNPNSYQNVYLTDCENLYGTFLTMLGEFKGLLLSQFTLQFISSFNFGITEQFFGFTGASPFSGLSLVTTSVITTFLNLGLALSGINLAVTFVLSVFFGLLPLFFFVGLLLRTFPWTRAAGGAFLGLFGGFYIAFPSLIYLMTIAPCASGCTLPAGIGGSSFVQQHLTAPNNGWNIFSNAWDQFTSYFQGWDFSALFLQFDNTIQNVIGPSIYMVVSIVIAFFISYDLLEALGDLLGAPALSSQHTLKKLL